MATKRERAPFCFGAHKRTSIEIRDFINRSPSRSVKASAREAHTKNVVTVCLVSGLEQSVVGCRGRGDYTLYTGCTAVYGWTGGRGCRGTAVLSRTRGARWRRKD
eukprot:scaffold15060_cov131-Isochrysis_galbana.AAC.2